MGDSRSQIPLRIHGTLALHVKVSPTVHSTVGHPFTCVPYKAIHYTHTSGDRMTARRQSTLIDCLTLDSIVDQCSTCIPNMVLFAYWNATNSCTFQSHIDATGLLLSAIQIHVTIIVTRSLSRARTRHSTTQPDTYRPWKPLSLHYHFMLPGYILVPQK